MTRRKRRSRSNNVTDDS